MSFWESVKVSAKKAAISTKCFAGMHAGDFTPIVGKPKCNQEKTCPDCNKKLEQIKHKFGKFEYAQENKCDGKYVCIHCQEEDAKVKHQWSYESSGCDSYNYCKRCKTKDKLKTKHTWYGGVCHGDGTQTFSCGGCNATERRKIDYDNMD